MADVEIYHNPRCSKSRAALDLLREHGVDCEVIEYLEHPPDRTDLERLVRLLPGPPGELVRRDPLFADLGLGAGDVGTADAVVDLLLAHPRLMQRPVVIRGDRAVIARPPEKLLELLPQRDG